MLGVWVWGSLHEFRAPFKKCMSLCLICIPRMNVYVMKIKLLGIFSITKAIKKVITRDSKHHQHLINFSFMLFSSVPCLGFVAVLFLPNWCRWASSGKREPRLRKSFILLASLWGIFPMNDWCGRALTTVGDTIPGQLVLGCMRKQAERVRERSQAVVILWFCFTSCLQVPVLLEFLPWPPSMAV